MLLSCSGDAMFLALVSMLQVTHPTLLKPAGDGFDVDVTPLLNQKDLTDDERLVLRIYGVLANIGEQTNISLELNAIEAARLDRALALVQSASTWPSDALALTSTLRAQLQTPTPPQG
jgi:hypothetical protein